MIPLRDENPIRITPWLTYLLIAINVVIFLMEQLGGIGVTRDGLVGPMAGWTLIPAEITRGQDIPTNGVTLQPFYLTLFTSMFMHGGWLHLLGNMLYLWIFGNNIEDAMGRSRYLFFYLICGLAASAAQIAIGPDSVIPNLGASGAIAGVLGAYLVLFPTARVDSLLFLGIFLTKIRVPAFILLCFWIVSQFFSHFLGSLTMRGGESGGVAYMAHIGGFIAGMILVRLMLPPDYKERERLRKQFGQYDTPYTR